MTTPTAGEKIDAGLLLEQRNQLLQVFEGMERNQRALERMVAALKTELEVKNNELRRKNRMVILGEMAACLAHEIRNQLGGLELSAKLLKRDLAGDADGAKPLELILAAVAALNTLVGDMLTYTGNLNPRPEKVSIPSIVRHALETARAEIARACVQVNLGIPAGLPDVHADPAMISRVFLNIVINAAHAMPDGGELNITADIARYPATAAGQHTTGAGQNAPPGDSNAPANVNSARVLDPLGAADTPACADVPMLSVYFKDTGCGLPPEAESKLFTPFFTSKAQGTGLGLAIAYRMVREAHGGLIEGKNNPEGGATFVVRLPVRAESKTLKEGQAKAADGSPRISNFKWQIPNL